jgi:hypothetical protein
VNRSCVNILAHDNKRHKLPSMAKKKTAKKARAVVKATKPSEHSETGEGAPNSEPSPKWEPPESERTIGEWTHAVYDSLTSYEKAIATMLGVRGAWDELTITTRTFPEDGRMLRTMIGNALRGGVWNLIGWAKAAPVPEVKEWASHLLADIVTSLEHASYAKRPVISKQAAAFQERWNANHRVGRGISDFAVVPIFATLVMKTVENLLDEVLKAAAPGGMVELDKIESPAERELWRFVAYFLTVIDDLEQPKREPVSEPDFIRHAFHSVLCSEPHEDAVLNRVLVPLAKEMWPEFIHQPGMLDFTGVGRVKIGRPARERVNNSKNGKPVTDIASWDDYIIHALKEQLKMRRVLHGDGAAVFVKPVRPTRTRS